ncbi:MAG: hypothetical protein PUC08_08510 [Bacteroidales bacterium]|nr:hypothetical protein [Bacteroidales bacterium]
MIQKRNRFSTNSQKSKKIALDFQALAKPKMENMKRRFAHTKRRFVTCKKDNKQLFMPYFRTIDCLVFDTIIVTLQSVCRKVVADGRNKSSEIEVICLETPFIKRQNLWRIKQVWQNLRAIGVPFSEV